MSGNLTKQEFLQIYDNYKDIVYNQTFRILGNREDADEAAQDVFLRIYKFYGDFRGESKLSSWIYKISMNVCFSRLKSKRKDIDYMEEKKDVKNIYEKTDNPEKLLQSKELKDMILNKISKLPEKYSSILTLFYFEEMNYKEISEVLNIPEGTIATHLFRAKFLLKDLIID